MRSHYDSSAVSFDKNSRMPYMNERRKTLQIYQRGLEARGNKKLSSPDHDDDGDFYSVTLASRQTTGNIADGGQ